MIRFLLWVGVVVGSSGTLAGIAALILRGI
jgi:hypothetical protein